MQASAIGDSGDYLEGPTSITLFGGFERGNTGYGVTVALQAIRQPWSHPQARS